MFAIRAAHEAEFERVRTFYHSLIDAMEDAQYKPKWVKDVYPSQDFLRSSIEAGELYIGEDINSIAACMVLNHAGNEEYERVVWPTQAQKDEVMVLHALGVHPAYAGRGFGRLMVRRAIALTREARCKALRLDVLKGNLPPRRLYESEGFRYVRTIPMYYEDTGWTDFELFEYVSVRGTA